MGSRWRGLLQLLLGAALALRLHRLLPEPHNTPKHAKWFHPWARHGKYLTEMPLIDAAHPGPKPNSLRPAKWRWLERRIDRQ